jgi:hypothetical protein
MTADTKRIERASFFHGQLPWTGETSLLSVTLRVAFSADQSKVDNCFASLERVFDNYPAPLVYTRVNWSTYYAAIRSTSVDLIKWEQLVSPLFSDGSSKATTWGLVGSFVNGPWDACIREFDWKSKKVVQQYPDQSWFVVNLSPSVVPS